MLPLEKGGDLLRSLFKPTRKVVGIDLGASSITLVEVLHKNRQHIITKAVREPIKNEDGLRNFLLGIKDSLDLKKSVVSVSVHGSKLIARVLSMPLLEEDELRQALKFEEEVYMPFPVEERISDFAVLKKGASEQLVLLVGARKSTIEEMVKPFLDAEIPLAATDISGICLVNLFDFINGPKAKNVSVLLDIGDQYTIFAIQKEGLPMLIRDISIGGRMFTEQIEDAFRISYSEAELLKCNPTEDKKKSILKAMEPIFYRLLEEVRVSMEYTGNLNIGEINTVYVSGGGSRTIGLIDYFKRFLGISVETWDPLAGFEIGKGVNRDNLEAWKYSLHIALGAALR